MRMKLNKRAIDAARYQGPGADYRWDTEAACFGLRVYPSGRKSFVVTYRVRGRQRFYTIGRYGEMPLQQARADALETLGKARKGADPSGDRRASRRAPTMSAATGRNPGSVTSPSRSSPAWARCWWRRRARGESPAPPSPPSAS